MTVIVRMYNDLFAEYDALQDNDPETAFQLMKQASVLLGTEETKEAELDKYCNKLKTLAEAVEAEKCLDYAGSVAKGEKYAACEDSVMKAWEAYHNAKQMQGETVALIKYLYRVYYDCKELWQQGARTLRQGRDG